MRRIDYFLGKLGVVVVFLGLVLVVPSAIAWVLGLLFSLDLSIVRDTCTSRTQVVNPMPPIMEPGEFFMPYPLEVEVGGATVFVVPVDRYERL